MIELAQPGQAGKTTLLFDMHRLRKRVFKDLLGWDVSITQEGLEVDEFDLPESVYLLALDQDKHVIGTWRMLCSTGPTMIRNIWPEFLETIHMPSSANVWEVSRFTVYPLGADKEMSRKEIQSAIAEMFCGLTEICIRCGIDEIFTFYDERIARFIKRLDCEPYAVSEVREMYGTTARVGAFKTDHNMLQRLRAATGLHHNVSDHLELPPALIPHKEAAYG